MLLRVDCGLEDVMRSFSSITAFRNVDFPTFVCPRTPTKPHRKGRASFSISSPQLDDPTAHPLVPTRVDRTQVYAARTAL
jgi:hypothetical protein